MTDTSVLFVFDHGYGGVRILPKQRRSYFVPGTQTTEASTTKCR